MREWSPLIGRRGDQECAVSAKDHPRRWLRRLRGCGPVATEAGAADRKTQSKRDRHRVSAISAWRVLRAAVEVDDPTGVSGVQGPTSRRDE